MARVFLENGDTGFTVSNSNTTVIAGAAATGVQVITIASDATGVIVDQSVERVIFAGASNSYTYAQAGNQIKVYLNGALVATIPVQGAADTTTNGTGDVAGTQLTFTDGTANAVLTGTVMALGGTTVAGTTTTPAAVTPTTIDTTVVSGTVTGGTVTGQSYSLTTATEVKALTAGNDTVDGSTVANSISGDAIVDTSTTDADVANIKISSAPTTAPVISGVETINMDFAGFGVNFTASGVSNGAIVASSSLAGVTSAAITNLNGTNGASATASGTITTLTVNDVVNNPTITLGTATTLELNGTTDNTDTATIKASGNTTSIKDTVVGADELKTLNIAGSSSASTITLETGVVEIASTSSVVLSGDQSLTVKAASSDVTGVTVTDSTTAGTTTLQVTGTANTNDLSKAAVDVIKFSAVSGNHTITFASGANVTLSQDSTTSALDLKASSATTNTTNTMNLTLAGDASITDDNTAYFTTVNATAADTTTFPNPTTAGTAFKAILNSDVTLNIKGTTALNLDTASVAKKVDASTYTGALTASVVASKVTNLVAGSGNDSLTIGTDATAFTVDGGAGTDTLTLTTGAVNIATVTATNIEILDLNNVTVSSAKDSMFSGKSLVVKSTAATAGTIAIDTLSTSTVDLSSITVDSTTMAEFTTDAAYAVTMDLNAQALSLTLKGTNGSDSIQGGSNADVIYGNDGADALVGNAGADTIYAGEGIDKITSGTGADTINLTETTAAIDTIVTTVGTAYTTATADTITGFKAGSAAAKGDILQIDISDSTAIASLGIVAAGDGSTAITGDLVIRTMTAGTGITLNATDEIVVISGTLADSTALIASIGAGTGVITKSTTNSTTNGLLVVWSDGTNTHVSTVADAGTDAAMTSTDLSVVDLVILAGVVTNFDTVNFTAVA